jgi:hypothetical protein
MHRTLVRVLVRLSPPLPPSASPCCAVRGCATRQGTVSDTASQQCGERSFPTLPRSPMPATITGRLDRSQTESPLLMTGANAACDRLTATLAFPTTVAIGVAAAIAPATALQAIFGTAARVVLAALGADLDSGGIGLGRRRTAAQPPRLARRRMPGCPAHKAPGDLRAHRRHRARRRRPQWPIGDRAVQPRIDHRNRHLSLRPVRLTLRRIARSG